MLGTLAKAGEELDGQKVEKSAHEASDAILRLTVLSRAVLDCQFAHFEPASMGQYRDETVQFTVEPNLAGNLCSEQFQATIVIV